MHEEKTRHKESSIKIILDLHTKYLYFTFKHLLGIHGVVQSFFSSHFGSKYDPQHYGRRNSYEDHVTQGDGSTVLLSPVSAFSSPLRLFIRPF